MARFAYKGFDSNLCGMNDFKYEVGKTYVHDGEIEPHKSGFHACLTLEDVYMYGYVNVENDDNYRYAEVLVENFIESKDKTMVVAKKITIVREIPVSEFFDYMDKLKNLTHANGYKYIKFLELIISINYGNYQFLF